MKKNCFLLLGLLWTIPLWGQQMNGMELLDKSIAYHDAQALWGQQQLIWPLEEKRPDGQIRETLIQVDPQLGRFVLEQERGKDQLWRQVQGDSCQHQLNGRSDFTFDQRKKHRLTCDYTKVIRAYYLYLWGLPMKLKDAGTKIAQVAHAEEFQGQPVWTLKVTYEETVGKDIWYFYFDRQNYALRGYRFYHDEASNDGEYITLEQEVLMDGIRYPQIRKWYTNKENKYLGEDRLISK
ncbi:MAG: DUF6503 family protein [Bacteroidota bacterium]